MPKASNYFWKIDRFAGGESDDSRIGLPGSFRPGSYGLNYRKDSGLLQVANKPVKHSDTTVNFLAKWIKQNPANGDVYAYGGSKIVKEVSGTYSLVRTIGSDSPAGQGLGFFNGKLYYASDTYLGRFDLASTWTDNYKTDLTSAPWHPICQVKNKVLIGHARYIATVDDLDTYTNKALTLPPGYYVRSIFRAASYAIILATFGDGITDSDNGYMFIWNTTSDQYNEAIELDGNPHAGISHKNLITIITGHQPQIQQSQGGAADLVANIPDVGDGYTAEVYPGAIALWRSLVHFGISAGTSTGVQRVVRSFGRKNSGFLQSVNPEFPISTGTQKGTGIQIGAVEQIGTTLRFSWKDGTSYGIDQVDTSAYQAEGVYRSLAFDGESPYPKESSKIIIDLAESLKTNEKVTVKLSPDPYDDKEFTGDDVITFEETTVGIKQVECPLSSQTTQLHSPDLHLEVRLGGTAATKPQIKRIWMPIDESTDTI